ncbi:basic secretory family protein [Pedobacter insulae]|uniref:Peptidase n=1 Tax=Pedobacter insulae TaxID=414048 RepID=A0A1I2ZME2_9SPHI|nr:basic secretory family protein [Pedobacter insulae]SFH38993.1 Peptidase [Pedobacter insulae]
MTLKLSITFTLLLASSMGFAQSYAEAKTEEIKKNNYTLELVNPDSFLDSEAKNNIADVFFDVYPKFSVANHYRTKRRVVFKLNPEMESKVNAKVNLSEAQIEVGPQWLTQKKKVMSKSLQAALASNWVSSDTTRKKGYTLIFINKDPQIAADLQSKLTKTFFAVYPKLVKEYNRNAKKEVIFVVDTGYKAVAEASGGRILFSARYMKANSTDVDVVTHEGMHVVQEYGYSGGPVWLTEGIADYVRYKFGYDNVGSKWSLPAFNTKQSYKNSYRITARFFAWLEQNVKPGLIASLDQQLRTRQYSEQSWIALTGKSVDQLWDDYAKNPDQVILKYSSRPSK